MNHFSSTIVNQMIENDVIEVADRDYYVYRITALSETMMTVATVLIIAAILKKLDVAIAFLTSFMALRKQTGGLHLDSFGKCYLSSIALCIGSVFLAEYLTVNKYVWILTTVCTVIIMVIGCVNHPNLDFDDSELSLIKKRARITAVVEMIAVIVLCVFNVKSAIVGSIELAVIFCTFFMIMAKALHQEVSRNDKCN